MKYSDFMCPYKLGYLEHMHKPEHTIVITHVHEMKHTVVKVPSK